MEFILIVSRHQGNFSKAQLNLVGKPHGRGSIITFDNKRFESIGELLDYHDEMRKNYDFIYYTLPWQMKLKLKEHGKVFGVILAPKKTSNHVTLEIVHHLPNMEGEVLVARKKLPRRGCKSYKNTPSCVRKTA
jgi:hypothetical protein